jgi:type II secretory ATPase GspE/PulE/Tfp pilus assembly ATPase PilB-like protein
MNPKDIKIRTGEAMVQLGYITQDQLSLCLRAQSLMSSSSENIMIGALAMRYGFASRDQVDEAVKISGSHGNGLSSIQIGASLLRRLKVMPLSVDSDVAYVAALAPLSEVDHDEIIGAYKTEGISIKSVRELPRDRMQISTYLQKLTHIDPVTVAKEVAEFCSDHMNGSLLHELVQHIFHEALQMRSSDVHIERSTDPLFCLISYRIDGRLVRRHLFTVEAMASLSTRIKMMADLDASEKHRPQDGRMSIEYHGRKIDIRISTIHREDGESIVIRLLDPAKIQTIEQIMSDHPMIVEWAQNIANVRSKEGGLILVTGPTGTGKSTTMTSILMSMNREKLKILTAEDPVEIRIPLVSQSNTTETLGYAQMIRSFMRQDPDVMVVGEIRDQETAVEALKGAETGHLMMSTLHVNSVIDSIKRMISLLPDDQKTIGLFTLAHRLKLIINQRLALRLCACSHEVEASQLNRKVDQALFKRLDITSRDFMIRRRNGCSRCDHTGYYGRVLMAEGVWFPSDERTRESMEKSLIQSNLSGLLQIEGVRHYSRENAIKQMLLSGSIDIDIALVMADINSNDHKEAA